jgi:hypothetical protein
MIIETARSDTFLPNLFFEDRHPAPENILQEVLEGLGRRQKSLPPKLFYDREGSDLFLRITGLWNIIRRASRNRSCPGLRPTFVKPPARAASSWSTAAAIPER